MEILDIILSAVLIYALIRGFMKGFFVEVTSLVALALGLYGAIHFSYIASSYLKNSVDWSEKSIQIVAFAITFFLIVGLISLTGKLLTKVAETAALGIVNKIFGAVLGFLKMGLILSVVLIIFSKFNSIISFVNEEKLEASILYTPVKNIAPMLFPSILNKEIRIVKKETE